jgi:lysophospholipase L1-like esterase
VLAFGDSITNGGGELQWGVALQSWALWTARSLGLPYTGYAVDAARVSDVVGQQIPAFRARSPHHEARYDVGCLYIGVNDVRALDWDPPAFETDFAAALSFIAERCDRTLALTAPRRLGLPSAGPKVPELNAIVTRVASAQGALLVDLGSFGARNFVMADRVHPTAFGQIAIAERALAVLERDGLAPRVQPASLIRFAITRSDRLRGDWTYAYRSAKAWARFAALKLRARALAPVEVGRSGARSDGPDRLPGRGVQRPTGRV